jgi:hypothetical protein
MVLTAKDALGRHAQRRARQGVDSLRMQILASTDSAGEPMIVRNKAKETPTRLICIQLLPADHTLVPFL